MRITTNAIQPFENKHLERLRRVAPECMVLLKKNGDFPLDAPCRIALYGAGARHTIKGGTGSGNANVRHLNSIEESLTNAGFTITSKEWLDAYDDLLIDAWEQFYDEVKESSNTDAEILCYLEEGQTPNEAEPHFPLEGKDDICIYVLSRKSGEGADRLEDKGDLLLSDGEVRDICACAKKYQKFMLVLNVGGPIDLSPVLPYVENILLLSQLGSATADAFADVLLGKAYPSGKLTATWMADGAYCKLGDFAEPDDTKYIEGVFTGYRYYDAAKIIPLFPFGFGLGYSDFSLDVETITVEDDAVKVSVSIKNVGSFKGKETVQLYYSAPDGKLKKPLRELGAYAKTNELLPNEEQTLVLELPIENMASWDTQTSAWILEAGDYVIYANTIPTGIVCLTAPIVTQRLSDSGGKPDFTDWEPECRRVVPENLTRFLYNGNISGHYDRKKTLVDHDYIADMSDFTDEELAIVCAGKLKNGSGSVSVIGNAACQVAGAAGETADVVQKKGFGKLVLSDGPAGLRLAASYVEDDDGAHDLHTGCFLGDTGLFPEPIQRIIRAKEDEAKRIGETNTICYHYPSAIPIGTALAQSWNPAVAEECGDIIGEEMEYFGVNVWLAPALNIQRSPLCGRNFEYYSEDPLISGRTAGAMTRGVQAHKGCAVTIKHFVCNNQETNRFCSNSIVSQRALREIYLKGFEICVKESAPKSLMTSYNLLNGEHTAVRRDLLTDILRNEFGFTGFVMSDWGTTEVSIKGAKYGASRVVQCIKAGNDLIMPGNREDIECILSGLANGELTRDELMVCASRIAAAASVLKI